MAPNQRRGRCGYLRLAVRLGSLTRAEGRALVNDPEYKPERIGLATRLACCQSPDLYSFTMRAHKVWMKQCKATRGIRRRYGAASALDYLIGEKLLNFAASAEGRPEFKRELPRFLAAIWQVFNPFEIAGYVSYQKPKTRNALRALLYVR